MNAQELAEKLNGVAYRNEVTDELEKQAKADGLVIVFGASDDLMEFRGAIYDEVGAWEGGSAFVTKDGLIENECAEGDDCPYFKKQMEKAQEIEAVWCPEDEGEVFASWWIQSEIPHHNFDVVDGDELYCRGLVFSLAEVKAKN